MNRRILLAAVPALTALGCAGAAAAAPVADAELIRLCAAFDARSTSCKPPTKAL